MTSRQARRVAVTGIGVVASCGTGVNDFWSGLHHKPDTWNADIDPKSIFEKRVEAHRSDRVTHLAVAAAAEATNNGNLLASTPETARGVNIGTAMGGTVTTDIQMEQMRSDPELLSPLFIPMSMINAPAGYVSTRFRCLGPSEASTGACASGALGLLAAARAIRDGYSDLMIAGGTEAMGSLLTQQGFRIMKAMSPTGSSLPFREHRDGFAMSEGAGILVLEPWESAEMNGHPILAEFLGGASTCDAYHMTAPAPDGDGAVRCMQAAMVDAQIDPSDVTYVNAHGTGTPLNDTVEAEAIAAVFKDTDPWVTSIKGATGHTIGAAGALEAVSVVLSMTCDSVPPTVGEGPVDPAAASLRIPFDDAVPWDGHTAISNSFGFGGHNVTLVFRRP